METTVNKKISELMLFVSAAQPYSVNKTPKLKIEFAIQKVLFRISQVLEKKNKEYNEKAMLIRESFALVDKEGCYVYTIVESGGKPVEHFKFTKENADKMKLQLRELEQTHLESAVDLQPHILQNIPPLNEWEVHAFRGLIIPQDYELPEPIELQESTNKN